MKKKVSSESFVKDIHSKTRKKYSSEEKIRIVLEGLRGEDSIARLRRREAFPPISVLPIEEIQIDLDECTNYYNKKDKSGEILPGQDAPCTPSRTEDSFTNNMFLKSQKRRKAATYNLLKYLNRDTLFKHNCSAPHINQMCL